jgi:hypothetical protein
LEGIDFALKGMRILTLEEAVWEHGSVTIVVGAGQVVEYVNVGVCYLRNGETEYVLKFQA